MRKSQKKRREKERKKQQKKKKEGKNKGQNSREREREREREKISRKKTPPHRDPAPIQIGSFKLFGFESLAREFEATTPLSLPFDTTTNRALVSCSSGVVVEGVEKCRRRRRRRASLRRDRL